MTLKYLKPPNKPVKTEKTGFLHNSVSGSRGGNAGRTGSNDSAEMTVGVCVGVYGCVCVRDFHTVT